MGNAWLDFLAEERDKDENKDVPPMELSSHVRPKYDDWKKANGIDNKSAESNKMEDVVVIKKKRHRRRSAKKNGTNGYGERRRRVRESRKKKRKKTNNTRKIRGGKMNGDETYEECKKGCIQTTGNYADCMQKHCDMLSDS